MRLRSARGGATNACRAPDSANHGVVHVACLVAFVALVGNRKWNKADPTQCFSERKKFDHFATESEWFSSY